MDELDVKIINALTKDPQRSFLSIVKEIGVSSKTVQTRYKKLQEEGIILLSCIIIDLSKLGYQGKAYLMITNTHNHDKKETIEALKQMRNVFTIVEIIAGDIDVLALAAVKDFTSIVNLVNEVRKLPSVDNVEVTFTN
ncbi:MAG TPA: Lrp/AsnC family transcriptional regulator, partial [Candidatus Bathyarchaeia archaeon]